MRPRGGRRTDNERDVGPKTRVNEMIRVREVLLIDETGANMGVKQIADAQRYAEEKQLDLVEISPQARPPVCRVMDYGKYKYELNIKAKEARRNRNQIVIKEIKYRPKIGKADYETKTNHVRRFLGAEDKVKVTIMFRGREMAHPELGRNILERVAQDVSDMATVETRPNLEGRNMTMLLAPKPIKKDVDKPAEEDGAPTTTDTAASEAPVAEAPAPASDTPAAEAPAPTEATGDAAADETPASS